MFFADVILPLPLRQVFTYELNEVQAAFLKAGMRVVVPFGKAKIYTAILLKVHQTPPAYPTKPIEFILDEHPLLSPKQLQLFLWMSRYYLATLGEVVKMGVPATFLLESETIVEKTEEPIAVDSLSDEEFLVWEALAHASSLTTKEVSKIVQKKNVIALLKSLLDKGAIRLTEKIFERYKPKMERYVCLAPAYQDKVMFLLEGGGGGLLKSQAQERLLWAFVALRSQKETRITPQMLLEKSQVSQGVLKKLVEAGILEVTAEAVDRVSFTSDDSVLRLSPVQQQALEAIEAQFAEKETVLLRGVASSGKTLIYSKLIEKTLAAGKQVLYLLPEIGLSVQLMNRLEHFFGEQMSVYHSKYSSNERAEVWNNVLKGAERGQFVLGVRGAVCLPFQDLGLIIVDEEHDSSYKQSESAPRFQVRDTALLLAHLHGAKTLLGSATPSVESYHNAKSGKYGYVELLERFSGDLPPLVELIDLKEKNKKKAMQGHFSDTLIEAIAQTLSDRRQVILLQNRRGYAPYLQCDTCDSIPQCPNCDVSLTYHQLQNQLRCHYCGYTITRPASCPACGSHSLETKGLGTEKVEEELEQLFPKARIERMDMDTTKGKYGFEKIIHRLEKQETDILVGTQMVSKGLDFPAVGLVGIMNADLFLHQPDFRASERGFQLLSHLAGRAGREEKQGKVLIQAYNPFQSVLQQVKEGAYIEMVTQQLQERKDFHYPPFYRLIRITFKHKELERINQGSGWFAESLRLGLTSQGVEVLGAEFPSIARIRNEYIKHILLKIPPTASLSGAKDYILRVEQRFYSVAVFRPIQLFYNVDI